MLWTNNDRLIQRVIGPHNSVDKECACRPQLPISFANHTPPESSRNYATGHIPFRHADLVRVEGHEDWSPAQLSDSAQWLTEGIHLDGERLRPARVEWLNSQQLRVTLFEGRHRQIRRMCAAVGLKVAALKRTRIGNLKLKDLRVGNWIQVTDSAARDLGSSKGT